jgi:hypothetical protein
MISRVIEAKADDMRAFVEEAGRHLALQGTPQGNRGAHLDTRENLERLQDVRDEVDKQIRHLQRQAATARRYQVLKETERRLTAELLALRLREIDSGAEVQDSAVRECELTMQQALADQRSAEGRDRDAACLSERAIRARQRGAGPLLRDRRGDQPHREQHRASRASCASSSATSWRRRARRWPSSTRTSIATSARSPSCVRRSRSSRRTSRRRRAAEGTLTDRLATAEQQLGRLATALGRVQPRARRRAPDHAGRARAYRAARESIAPASRARPTASPSSAKR